MDPSGTDNSCSLLALLFTLVFGVLGTTMVLAAETPADVSFPPANKPTASRAVPRGAKILTREPECEEGLRPAPPCDAMRVESKLGGVGLASQQEGRGRPRTVIRNLGCSIGLVVTAASVMPDAAIKYTVFGRTTEFVVAPELREPLLSELSMYPRAESNSPTELRVSCEIRRADGPTGLPACPKEHGEFADGFMVRRPIADASFRWPEGAPPQISLYLRDDRTQVMRWKRKWRNMQFSTVREHAGQILHEMGLVPALHLSDELLPIHASSVTLDDGRAIAIGGTGGVGKTSLELELCLGRKRPFLADDISVSDSRGNLWPNFNFPKFMATTLSRTKS